MKSYKFYLGDKLILQSSGLVICTACPSGGMKPNEMYVFGQVPVTGLTINLADAENPVWDNEWKGCFINTGGFTVTWGIGINTWVKGAPPTFDSSKVTYCEFSVVNGIADYSLTEITIS